jgi:L-ascorbate metabolism protein UlaG (beta-lactamase superfamily)
MLRIPSLRRVAAVLGTLGLALGAAVPLSTSGCASFGGTPEGARLARIQESPRYIDGKFTNEDPTEMMREGSARAMRDFVFGNGEMREPICVLPMAGDSAAKLKTPPPSGLRITWLGHSTTLIEVDGATILTDPVWSERASPSTLAGPKRFHPPPLSFDALPRIDAVIVSHDHYDHLDMATVQRLSKRGVTFFVGLGVGAHLERWAVPAAQIVELEWWQERALPKGVKLVSTPSRHFSGRGLFNRDGTLWTSWSILGPTHRVFFSGDTGLTPTLETIGKRLGPFDVSMLEIGQWHPSWGHIHLGPQGALEAHRLLGAKVLFPIHWSTFLLGLHAWSEPPETLVTAAEKSQVSVVTPMLGEPVEPLSGIPTARWWRELPPMTPRCPQGEIVTRRPLDAWPL